jgi:long-chain fatty acid transport protein
MKSNHVTSSIAITALLAGSMSAHATNGYFRLGYSANNIAMGGASTAAAHDAMAGSSNPALALGVEENYTAALSIFAPDRGFTVETQDASITGPFPLADGEYRSDSEAFLIPSFGYNRKVDDRWAVNMSLYGNGGMNTDYSESVFGAGETGVDLSQLFLNVSVAYALTDSTHIGLAPILGYQRFAAKGLDAFGAFSQDANSVSGNGHDSAFGYGARVGILHQIDSNWSVGASYQSELKFEEFDKYKGLFAEDGRFNVPETYNLGFAYSRETYTFAVDYQHINYSTVQSVGNPILPNLMQAPLGAQGGAGFGWEDMGAIEAGLAIYAENGDTYRMGVSYADAPIPNSEVLFNILAPGVQEWHLTAGYEFATTEADYSVTLMYSPSNTVKGTNPLYPGQTIELEMSQLELTLGASF